jgi:hypothetical protein
VKTAPTELPGHGKHPERRKSEQYVKKKKGRTLSLNFLFKTSFADREREAEVAQQPQQQHKRQVTRFLGIHQRRCLTRKRTPS